MGVAIRLKRTAAVQYKMPAGKYSGQLAGIEWPAAWLKKKDDCSSKRGRPAEEKGQLVEFSWVSEVKARAAWGQKSVCWSGGLDAAVNEQELE